MKYKKDRSAEATLREKTTKELDEALAFYLNQESPEDNIDNILLILEILKDREKDLPVQVPPRVLELYHKLYGNSQ